SAALELAIAAGDVRPGTRGWRPEQERFTHAFLTQPDAQGRSRLDRIREERARGWLGSPSHPHRQRLWPLLGRLIGGAEVPQDAAEALAPVRRLLDFADEGIGLTQIGYISPSVVRELCAEFDWATSPSPPRSETDAMQLIVLNKLLRGMRAVRRSGRRLVLTRRGRHLRSDDRAPCPAAAWCSPAVAGTCAPTTARCGGPSPRTCWTPRGSPRPPRRLCSGCSCCARRAPPAATRAPRRSASARRPARCWPTPAGATTAGCPRRAGSSRRCSTSPG